MPKSISKLYSNKYFVIAFQILSKADDNTVMEAVDSEVSVTCTDMNHVKKMFQLALLCTKRHPSDRPTMHEVSRVLISLLPVPICSKKPVFTPEPNAMDFSRFLMPSPVARHEREIIGDSSSDAHWFVRFGEAISKSSM